MKDKTKLPVTGLNCLHCKVWAFWRPIMSVNHKHCVGIEQRNTEHVAWICTEGYQTAIIGQGPATGTSQYNVSVLDSMIGF